MPAEDRVNIEINKTYLNFSAGHFTIFSATKRELLHGHNFRVSATVIGALVDGNGMTFDYNLLKDTLRALCAELDEHLLLPLHSPHLHIEQDGGTVRARFGEDVMSLPSGDVLLLPLRNISVEDLSGWFLVRLLERSEILALDCQAIELGVSSGDGQWGRRRWEMQV